MLKNLGTEKSSHISPETM